MGLQAFNVGSLDIFNDDKWYYIVHLLDEVLVGEFNGPNRGNDQQFQRIKAAVQHETMLEAHFFNEKQEIFVGQEEGQLVSYEPLIHEESDRIERCYELEQKRWGQYTRLTVMEYISYDQEDHFAYVERSALYSLE